MDAARLEEAARHIAAADALLITAGAGMGVDSGLPDFRGTHGFWRAYPALGRAGLRFEEIANPAAFVRDPALAWGFYGHRLASYRAVIPHAGFHILKDFAAGLPLGAFVFTSNVDGQFQKAGFAADRIVEIHGSIHHLQCTRPCSDRIWSAADFIPEIDTEACRLLNAPPRCPQCGALARPNILMFGDGQWVDTRTSLQQWRLAEWRAEAQALVVIEAGAGNAIPTVRQFGEMQRRPLIRINPADEALRPGILHLRSAAAAGLQALADARTD